MSGVYIPGMEMPPSCFYCPVRHKVDPDTILCLATGQYLPETFSGTIETRNQGKCPLVYVPHHGDLVDRKKIGLTDFQIFMCSGDYKAALNLLLEIIDHAPAVLPADTEGGGG